ncbi:MAG: hypothetical protein KBI01_08050 [Oscillospiraceae bacterium]|nr:hypothetical protein [Oscillospiraceae bacterium]
MKLIMCFAAFAAIAAADLPSIIKAKQWVELAKYAFVFLLTFTFAVFVLLDTNTSSPIKLLQTFYSDVLHLSFKQA